ncbi:unnamed protein product [Ascophyllum nodosum]
MFRSQDLTKTMQRMAWAFVCGGVSSIARNAIVSIQRMARGMAVAYERAAKAVKAVKAGAAAEAKATGAAKAAGDAVGACDSDSEIFRANVAELEAALKEEKRTSAAALVKACAAEAEKAVASATAITTASEADSMRETIVELKSALAREKEKVSAAEAATAVAVAAVESELNAKEIEIQEARLSAERMMVQMMDFANEIITKQEEIHMLKGTHKDSVHVRDPLQLLDRVWRFSTTKRGSPERAATCSTTTHPAS